MSLSTRSARHARRTRRPISSWLRSGTALVLLAGTAVVLPATSPAAAADPCRQPQLREVMISQGLPSYPKLVRGREAIVKFLLSEAPLTSCPDVDVESIQITGATLSVSRPGGVGSGDLLKPNPGSTAVIGDHITSPVPESGADPVFQVDADALLAESQTGSYAVTFTGTVDYVTLDHRGKVVQQGTIDVKNKPGTTTPITATVAEPSRPLRILFVPMHDAEDTVDPITGAADSFDETDEDLLVNALPALGRIFPVADGIGPIGSGAGVQYDLSEGIVDLGPHLELDSAGSVSEVTYLDANGVFCGDEVSFDYIAQELAEHRTLYNAENPTHPADRVVGVVSERISHGPSTQEASACAEGYASLTSPEAWARLVADAPALPAPMGPRSSTAGGLLAQELLHTYGGSTITGAFHSDNVRADRTALQRAFNTLQRKYLDENTNRTASSFGLAPWDQYTTLFEKQDWAFTLCVLSSTSATASKDCGSTATGSTSGGVLAAGGVFVLAGKTRLTAETTDTHTYFANEAPVDGVDDSSEVRLFERDAAGALLDPRGIGVRLSSVRSKHDDGDHTHTGEDLIFEVALPASGTAAQVELWKGTPDAPGAVLLYVRKRDHAPVSEDILRLPSASDAVRYTSDGKSTDPALNPAAPLIAWTTDVDGRSRVVVAPVAGDAGTAPVLVADGASSAAWHPSGTKIAVVSGTGDVLVADVHYAPTTKQVTVSSTRQVYDADLLASVPLPASQPSYSPLGDAAVVVINDDLWRLDLSQDDDGTAVSVGCSLEQTVGEVGVGGCTRLTATRDVRESSPAWLGSPVSAVLPNGAVSYGRTESTSGATPQVWGLSPNDPTNARVIAGSAQAALDEPVWSDRVLVLTSQSGLVAVDARSAVRRVSSASSPQPRIAPFTGTDGDAQATLARLGGNPDQPLRTAFVRATGSGRDVYLAEVESRTLVVLASDERPEELRLDVLVSCDASDDATVPGDDPVVTAARPVVVDEATGTALFHVDYRAGESCDADTILRLTDGYQVDRDIVPAEPGTGTPPRGRGNVAIHTPTRGDVLLQYQTLTVSGSAIGADRVPRDDITWRLSGPGGLDRLLNEEPGFPDVRPPAIGWASGEYTLTASLPDDTPPAEVVFSFTDDRDGDLLRDQLDDRNAAGRWCFPDDAVQNPSNALADPDGDLLPSLFDDEPCTSRMNATVRTTPTSLNTDSNGTPITAEVSTTAALFLAPQPSDVRIVQIAGLQTDMPATELHAVSPTSLKAMFDRQLFNAFVVEHALTGYLPVVVEVRTSTAVVRGYDPTAPIN